MKDYVIAISGEAGQGINTIGDMLALSLFRNGYCVFTDKSYHSRIRGGEYVYRIRISETPLYSMRQEFDLVVSLSKSTTLSQIEYFHDETVLVFDSDSDHVSPEEAGISFKEVKFPFKRMAKEAGEARAQNVVSLGALLNLLKVKKEIPEKLVKEAFEGKEEVARANLIALSKGYEIALPIEVPAFQTTSREYYLMNGTEGLADLVADQPSRLIGGVVAG